ncbi:MAG: OmpA family protein, partial [Candidatus Schmidhempelia sp.]|nr:OmpA family protein [Candidatus Schmidhempelia sp.]
MTFYTNSAVLQVKGINTLMNVTFVLKEFDKTVIHIIGHTDSTSAISTNEYLSLRKANSVAIMLIFHNIVATRTYFSHTATIRPIALNPTVEV